MTETREAAIADALYADLQRLPKDGGNHGALTWLGDAPDRCVVIRGHVDLMSLARAALAALPSCEGWRGIESALTALRALVAEKEKATRLQAAWRELYPDGQFYAIPSAVETAFVRLIDSILGPGENAAYLLYEAMQMKGGGNISINGTTYPIRTVDDLEAYLRASPPER